ncbi:MAG TPA: imidazole glycerol phosphate synthase subunit HisH [Candidatus Omnitrophica bacterium]|nr:imidazole glycerol phosphate synthase subunit HisH [Candidatus Omnitrophota bacterium]
MIVVIDYGLGNLRSVAKALEICGAQVRITGEPLAIKNADALVLPGVGAFDRGMENLHKRGIVSVLLKAIKEGKPLLGICLGLQLLFTRSEEGGVYEGLDVVKGEVKKFRKVAKIPHMGWNNVKFKRQKAKGKIDIFDGIPDNSYFYFVHSYYANPEEKDIIATTTIYGGEFTSAIARNNLWGVQFHPEKSGDLGLRILKNFIRIIDKC